MSNGGVSVHKFGGACFKNPQSFQKVVRILREAKKPWIAVPSAFYGVTDKLHSLMKISAPSRIEDEIKNLRSFHLSLIETNRTDEKIEQFDGLVRELESLLVGVALTGEVTAQTRDYVLSFGERLAALCLQISLKGLKTSIIDPSDVLRTNGVFYEASVNLEESQSLVNKFLLPLIKEDQSIIIPGYYGSDKDGNINLLGRSGTDYSAASIAYLLNAESLSIWKEVPAFMTADPAVIPEAEPLQYLSYDSSELLTLFGAKLIHPKALGPVRATGIPLYIRHLHDHKNFTLIGRKPEELHAKPVLSLKMGLIIATIYARTSSEAYRIINDLLQNFEESGTPIYFSMIIGAKIRLLFSMSHKPLLLSFLQSLEHLSAEFRKIDAIFVLGCNSDVLQDFQHSEGMSVIATPSQDGFLALVPSETSTMIAKKMYSHIIFQLS